MSASHPSSSGRPERASYRESLGFGVLSFASIAVLSLAVAIVGARLYGIETIGEYALAYSPTAAVGFLSNVGQQPALVRIIAGLPARSDRVSGVFLAVFAFSTAVTLVAAILVAGATMIIFSGPIGQPGLVGPALVSLAGYVVVTNPCWNLDIVMASFRAGRSLFWVRLHQAAVYLALVAAVYPFLPSVWGLIVALLGSWATSLGHRGLVSRRWLRFRVSREALKDGRKTLPQIIRFGLKITPGVLAEGASNEAGTWILGIASPVAAVGAWNRALMVGQRLLQFRYRIIEVLLPTLVERRESNDAAGFDRGLVDSLRYSTTALLMPAAVVGGGAYSIMSLFGPGFSAAAPALQVIVAVPVAATASSILTQALYAANQPFRSAAVSVGRLVVTVAASVPLTIELGITGAALGLAAGSLADVAVRAIMVRRQLSARPGTLWPLRQGCAVVVAYGAGFSVALSITEWQTGVVGLMAALILGTIAYAACVWAVGGLLPRDRERLRDIRRRLVRSRPRTPSMVTR